MEYAAIITEDTLPAWIALARRYWKEKRANEAVVLYAAIRAFDPACAAALEGQGLISLARGEAMAGRSLLERALDIDPSLTDAALNLAPILFGAGQPDKAQALLERLIAAQPDHAVAHSVLAQFLWGRGDVAAAFRAFDAAVTHDPKLASFVDTWCYERLGECDWRGYAAETAFIRQTVDQGRDVFQPFVLMLTSDSPAEMLQGVSTYAANRYPPQPAIWSGERWRHDRIRIGYVTADFYDHPVTNLLAGVFEHHDRSAFEITCFSHGPRTDDAIQRRLAPAFDRIRQLDEVDSGGIAAAIAGQEIDIAVTLSGYMVNARPGILAWRPAPVQVSYHGFAGSMGAPYIDYLIADRHVIPEADAEHYAEQIVWMPDSYHPTDNALPIAPKAPSRAEAGLPKNAFVFMAFNHTYKIAPAVFDAWMRILRQVPGSVLWLPEKDAATTGNLRREAAGRGIDPARLIFAPRTPGRADHLARHRLADLFLDTLPYSAHATASDALWAGLPVLTCRGTSFAGRVCTGLLTVAGLPELIAESLDEYEKKAVQLARNPGRLAVLRQRVRRDVRASRLFDTARYTKNLEAAYRTMYDTYQAGLAPRSFAV